jgi:hypothetical protein
MLGSAADIQHEPAPEERIDTGNRLGDLIPILRISAVFGLNSACRRQVY